MSRVTVVALVALLTFLVVASPAVAFSRTVSEATMLRLVNRARVSRGLHAVKVASPLRRAALAHSRDMLARDYFAHSSLAGATLAKRARSAGYSASGCSQWAVGEVIAFGSSSRGRPLTIFRAWMRSSAHRQVILTKRWRDVGIGCARGSYRGIPNVVMYTIDFGRRVR